VPLPGPYILTRAMWVKEVTREVYASKEELGKDVVTVLRQELEELAGRDHRAVHDRITDPQRAAADVLDEQRVRLGPDPQLVARDEGVVERRSDERAADGTPRPE